MPYELIVASFEFKGIIQKLKYIIISNKLPILFKKMGPNDFCK